MNFLRQVERYRVERFKRIGGAGRRACWGWVTVGHFEATSLKEARGKGREAIADKLCILRAVRVGDRELAPEGVLLR